MVEAPELKRVSKNVGNFDLQSKNAFDILLMCDKRRYPRHTDHIFLLHPTILLTIEDLGLVKIKFDIFVSRYFLTIIPVCIYIH